MRPPIQARLLPQETHAVDVVGALHCGRKIRVPSARIMIMPGSKLDRFRRSVVSQVSIGDQVHRLGMLDGARNDDRRT